MIESKADILKHASMLAINDRAAAARHLDAHYPFEKGSERRESISLGVSMEVFVRDGFIDRYSGDRLVNPGALRALSELLGKSFPYHRHGDRTQSHIAYWELRATVDHLVPLALGGPHTLDNFRTTSMLRNLAKRSATLEQLCWKEFAVDERQDWDGLSQWLLGITDRQPGLRNIPLIRAWCSATRSVLEK